MTDTAQPAATSYPANDPATRRTVPATSTPLDPQRIEALMAKEWERFTASTPGSAAHHARASEPLPLGVASSFQHWDPHPLAFKAAKGAWLTDVDDRQVLDLSMGFGAMLVGHLNPLVVEYVSKALETGTLFVTPSPTTTDIAERYQKRFHLEQVRFANSGTEADMYAVKAARAFTGKHGIVKIEGGYHGGYDALSVSVKPDVAEAGPEDAPVPVVPFEVEAGIVHVVPYNDLDRLEAILAEHGALGGNRQFALAGALCAADAIDVGALPGLMRASRLPAEGGPLPPLDVAPRPIVAAPRSEQVHLRFLVGSALASSVSAVAAGTGTGKWGIPFTQALSRALARPGVAIAALPRAPQSLPAAVATGRSAQREASAALFVSNAIRRLRAAVGEPVAVLSAHRVPGTASRGELRLSLSSPLDPREAEGFRCPLHPLDRVADVATMLADLLRECRVADVRWLAGVHGDRDPATGLTLLFKPDTVPPGAELPVH